MVYARRQDALDKTIDELWALAQDASLTVQQRRRVDSARAWARGLRVVYADIDAPRPPPRTLDIEAVDRAARAWFAVLGREGAEPDPGDGFDGGVTARLPNGQASVNPVDLIAGTTDEYREARHGATVQERSESFATSPVAFAIAESAVGARPGRLDDFEQFLLLLGNFIGARPDASHLLARITLARASAARAANVSRRAKQ